MALGEAELYACYRRMEKPLYNVLYRWLWQSQDCQDVIHDAFLRVWHRRGRVDAARLESLAWTTALNLARNRLRWRRLWRFDEADAATIADADPVEETARRQREASVRRALNQLPTAQRHVLLLSEFGDMDTNQIAHTLGIPPGTVGSRKHIALRRLREQLEEAGDDR